MLLSAVGPSIIRGIGSLFGGKTKEVTDKVADVVDAVKGQSPADQAKAIEAHIAQMTPEELQAFTQAKAQIVEAHANIMEAQANADAARITAVNQTMQAEAKSEHWMEWSWRPFNGFLFGLAVVGCYIVLPALKIPVPSVPEWVWIGWGSILGITTWHGGVTDRLKAGDKATAGSALGTLAGKILGSK